MPATSRQRNASWDGGSYPHGGVFSPYPGCAAGIVAGAGAAGATSAQKEKGFGASVDDAEIEVTLNARLLDAGSDTFFDVNTEVEEGRVLLAGTVETIEQPSGCGSHRLAGGGRHRSYQRDRSGHDGSVTDAARDNWITAQLETALLFDGEVSSIDYGIETVNQVVYLMGVGPKRRGTGTRHRPR